MEAFKKGVRECGLAALLSTVFSLFAAALFAVFVRAYAPSDMTIAIIDRVILAVGIFAFSLLFIRRGGALWKGIIAGVLSLLLTTLVFGLFGGLGALLGIKIRKE